MQLLYIIHNPTLQLTKIGITNNIKRRKRQLECASGTKLELYYYTDYYHRAKLIEQSLHQYFHTNRKEGEFFSIEPEVIKDKLLYVINNLSKIHKQL